MKKFLPLIIFALFTGCVSYQTITMEGAKNEAIVDVNGEKNKLFVRANEWMVQVFNSAESVIQFQDKEEGTIIGKYLLKSMKGGYVYGKQVGTDVYSIIKIMVKDNAAKISIEPQGTWQYDSSGMTIYNYSKEQAENDIKSLIADFEKYMTTTNDVW